MVFQIPPSLLAVLLAAVAFFVSPAAPAAPELPSASETAPMARGGSMARRMAPAGDGEPAALRHDPLTV
jgi:hypothetical protein